MKATKKQSKQNLVLEVNSKYIDGDKNKLKIGNIVAMVTPPLDEDYWQYRVKVDKDQAIVGFPKFSTIGIGFAKEDDWNTNLPYSTSAEHIFEYIKVNKYFASIPDETCIEAIKIIQKAADDFFKAEKELEDMVVFQNEPKLQDEKTGKILSKKEFKDRTQICRARKTELFSRTSFGQKTEISKRKYCLLFGYFPDQSAYKYKFTFYHEGTTESALERFRQTIRGYALHGEGYLNSRIGSNFESFLIATPEKDKRYGYKIPISF